MKNSYAVRGATTVEMDSPAAMDEAVCELFEEISQKQEYRNLSEKDRKM